MVYYFDMNTTHTILLAEDELDLRTALEAALVAAGHTVTVCSDGQEALDQLATALPDLVLLDIHMPQVSGIEVLKKIRTMEGGELLPVTMLTASDTMDLISEVTAVGGMHTDFLSKTEMSLQQVTEHVAARLQ